MLTENTTQTRIGLIRERMHGEHRVALTPNDVRRLAARMTIGVEPGAGTGAGFSDQAYVDAGAQLSGIDDLLQQSDVLLMIRPPKKLPIKAGSVVISLGGRDAELAAAMRAQNVLHLGLERLPRITRAQSMDVLSSQAAIAGYAAVIEGARELDVVLPMLTTAAGTIKPAKMIALGAGVAGLQAIATARRLGAITYGFDVREAAREQVESLGAKFVFPAVSLAPAEGAGGYASDQSAEQQQRLRHALAEYLAPLQLIVTSAQIPGRPAPILIDEEALAGMQAGSVIVDLAAESGGNCTLTRPDETVITAGGVHILGPTNLPSLMAKDASSLFGGNMRSLLEHLIDKTGRLAFDRADPITAALLADQVSERIAA